MVDSIMWFCILPISPPICFLLLFVFSFHCQYFCLHVNFHQFSFNVKHFYEIKKRHIFLILLVFICFTHNLVFNFFIYFVIYFITTFYHSNTFFYFYILLSFSLTIVLNSSCIISRTINVWDIRVLLRFNLLLASIRNLLCFFFLVLAISNSFFTIPAVKVSKFIKGWDGIKKKIKSKVFNWRSITNSYYYFSFFRSKILRTIAST